MIIAGDCLDVMLDLDVAGERFDAMITDPPYELKFMGKKWDGTGIAFRAATWRKAFAVLKPGAYLLAFGGTRTEHRMTVAIEDAGFEIRDKIMWIYGTGFPKSADQGGGWGTALKPAYEPIIVARKPLERGMTVAENVLRHGTGAINIDASRVPTDDKLGGGEEKAETAGQFTNEGWRRPWMDDPGKSEAFAAKVRQNVLNAEKLGRFPANVIHDGSPEVMEAFAAYGERKAGHFPAVQNTHASTSYSVASGKIAPERNLDTGTAARFFYSAKATAADRAGSAHPTVKPQALMRYLCTMATPPGGRILDPFAGSGSTLQAAAECGFHATGIELDPAYLDDIRARLAAMWGDMLT